MLTELRRCSGAFSCKQANGTSLSATDSQCFYFPEYLILHIKKKKTRLFSLHVLLLDDPGRVGHQECSGCCLCYLVCFLPQSCVTCTGFLFLSFFPPQKQFALIHCHTPLGNTQGRTHFVRMTLILSWPPNRTEIACFHQSLEPEDKVEKFLNDYDIICLDISWSTFSWKINLKLKVNIKFNGHYLANMVYSVLIWFQGNSRKFHKIQRLGI